MKFTSFVIGVVRWKDLTARTGCFTDHGHPLALSSPDHPSRCRNERHRVRSPADRKDARHPKNLLCSMQHGERLSPFRAILLISWLGGSFRFGSPRRDKRPSWVPRTGRPPSTWPTAHGKPSFRLRPFNPHFTSSSSRSCSTAFGILFYSLATTPPTTPTIVLVFLYFSLRPPSNLLAR